MFLPCFKVSSTLFAIEHRMYIFISQPCTYLYIIAQRHNDYKNVFFHIFLTKFFIRFPHYEAFTAFTYAWITQFNRRNLPQETWNIFTWAVWIDSVSAPSLFFVVWTFWSEKRTNWGWLLILQRICKTSYNWNMNYLLYYKIIELIFTILKETLVFAHKCVHHNENKYIWKHPTQFRTASKDEPWVKYLLENTNVLSCIYMHLTKQLLKTITFYTHTHTHIYIYIYRERERDRDRERETEREIGFFFLLTRSRISTKWFCKELFTAT